MTRSHKPSVVILRGQQVTPWELRPWEELRERFDIVCLTSRSNWFPLDGVGVPHRRIPTMRDLMPPGRVGDMAVRIPGDRYLGLARALRGADIVHAQELGYWYSMQAARLKPRIGFKLVLTVWETLPFLSAYRNLRTRRYRKLALERADLFLAATERARDSLLLEGVTPERIRVSPPGVDLDLFAAAASGTAPERHRIVSPGRLVWEKGHQDVLRAVAALHRGIVQSPDGRRLEPELLIVGAGPDERRLSAYARDLGIEHVVELRQVAHAEMPQVYASASCMVLASLSTWSWEEQFGMVLAEALAAGLPIVASSSGAIPEVLGDSVPYFVPGDWLTLARTLAAGPLARRPGERKRYGTGLLEHYSVNAAANRLADAYDELLG
jgi:glycosyltransferase involved in cell wall biosynthesis